MFIEDNTQQDEYMIIRTLQILYYKMLVRIKD